jgi:hypothetical protein
MFAYFTLLFMSRVSNIYTDTVFINTTTWLENYVYYIKYVYYDVNLQIYHSIVFQSLSALLFKCLLNIITYNTTIDYYVCILLYYHYLADDTY